jgi:predicted nuclease of predicted toxin-antitoxin system
MKLLLDENLPKQLLNDFSEYEVSTIQQNDWGGKTNSELLQLIPVLVINVFG